MRLKNIFLKTALCLFFTGCAHNEYVDQEVDTRLDQKNAIGNEQIIVNNDDEMILQEEKKLSENLEELQWKNESLESEVTYIKTKLNDCYTYLIDPRLGGNSQVFKMPEMDRISDSSRTEEISSDSEGKPNVVRKSFYLRRVEEEKQKTKIYSDMIRVLTDTNNQCQATLREARIKHGFPAEKYPALIKKDGTGKMIIVRPAEKNLDDAIRYRESEK